MRPVHTLLRSLAIRLALVYGMTSLVVIAALGASVYLLTARHLQSRARSDLEALSDFYAAYAAALAPDEAHLAAVAPQITGFFAPQAGYDVRLFNARSGALLATTRDIGPLPSSATLSHLGLRRSTLFVPASHDLPDRLYAARPLPGANGTSLAVVEVSRDLSEMQSFLGILRTILAAAGALIMIAALAASTLLAHGLARRLRSMQAATQVIAAGDFSRRLDAPPTDTADEIGLLAASINQMAADLARLEAARREFIAKISHDLRTPLSAIKGFVVNLQDSAPEEFQTSLATMDEQTDRLIRLVEDLLTLSRFRRGELHLRYTAADLSAVARSAVALVSDKAARSGIVLRQSLPERLPCLPADPDRLHRVVVNLLDNALRATPVGGTVEIGIAEHLDEVVLTVADSGLGLTDEEAARAFEPFERGPGGGAGLGLTIAQEIVTAHGGRIWLKPRANGGAEAGFALPVSRCAAMETEDDRRRAMGYGVHNR